MKTLTVVASNRDRLDLDTDITKFFIKLLENQSNKDFEVLIVDGGSKNYEELKEFFESRECEPSIRIIQEPLGEKFERAKLNNIGVRNAKTSYIMTTDVDLFFGKEFVEELLSFVGPDVFVESRTLYWKFRVINRFYSGELDPFNDLDNCKLGRIKKHATAGGCQCAHIDQWHKVGGFDESYVGWGSEDSDLYIRMRRSGVKIKWLGEGKEEIKLFHQPHHKTNKEADSKDGEKNLSRLQKMYRRRGKSFYRVNHNGWGGVYDKDV